MKRCLHGLKFPQIGMVVEGSVSIKRIEVMKRLIPGERAIRVRYAEQNSAELNGGRKPLL